MSNPSDATGLGYDGEEIGLLRREAPPAGLDLDRDELRQLLAHHLRRDGDPAEPDQVGAPLAQAVTHQPAPLVSERSRVVAPDRDRAPRPADRQADGLLDLLLSLWRWHGLGWCWWPVWRGGQPGPSRVRYSGSVATTTDMNNDRLSAADSASDAATEIENLQETDTWMLLPLEMRRDVCRAHALLAGLSRILAASTVTE